MADYPTKVPKVLLDAHTDLVDALERNMPTDPNVICLARPSRMVERIEKYVAALSLLPDLQEELRHRAEFVAQRCGESTDYASAGKKALARLRRQSKDQAASAKALKLLREWEFTPYLQYTLVIMRGEIETIIHADDCELDKVTQRALGNWHRECSILKNDAELLSVDGCWYLFNIHAYGVGPEREEAACAREDVDKYGVALLIPIREAVDSLMALAVARVSGDDSGSSPLSLPEPRAQSPSGSVVLYGPRENPTVNDKTKNLLTEARYDVVLAVLRAGERGLTKDELISKSQHGGARKVLKRLAEVDADWAAVIRFPGSTGMHYRIT